MNSNKLKEYIINEDKICILLEMLGCTNIKKHSKYYMCSTPKNTKATSTAIYNDLKVKVFAEGNKFNGDIFTFVMYLKDIKFGKAIKLVHSYLGLHYDGFNNTKDEEENKFNLLRIFDKIKSKRKNYNKQTLQILNNLTSEYIQIPYIGWIREGITPYTQKVFGVGYDMKSNRVVFPHRYWSGDTNDFVGLIGRTLNKDYDVLNIPKYFPLHSYLKGNNVYGLQENYEGIQNKGYVTVFEAEKSVMKRHSKKDFTGVAICCHEMTDEQAKILIGLNVEIIIAMDKDVDIYGVYSICDMFYGLRPIYYIYDEYNLLKDKESPADKQEKVYKVLFNRKIRYGEEQHKKYSKWLEENNK